MLKAKFRDHVRSSTDTAMKNEVLCKFLCHNICCVIQSQLELGIEAKFWQKTEAAEPVASEPAAVEPEAAKAEPVKEVALAPRRMAMCGA